MIDWQAITVVRQYANSPRLLRLLSDFNESVDPQSTIDQFITSVWDPRTATGYGLDVWGRIVGIGRVLKVADLLWLGFEQGEPTSWTFGEGAFYSGAASTSNYRMSDETYRRVIFAKAAANISDGSIASINSILGILFAGSGAAYVHDNLNMTMTYVLSFQPSALDIALLTAGVLPRTAGVEQNYVFINSIVTRNDFGGDIS